MPASHRLRWAADTSLATFRQGQDVKFLIQKAARGRFGVRRTGYCAALGFISLIFRGKTVIFVCQHSARHQQSLLKHIRVETQPNIKRFSMSSTTASTGDDSPTVHLVIADVWNEGEEESIEVHILLKSDEDEDLVQTVLAILAEKVITKQSWSRWVPSRKNQKKNHTRAHGTPPSPAKLH
ncbi:hypothetical protein Ddc_22290 [Ditylenchus destructor]|nr:hypothetical protein Ddc_22290 [Ditylenchus destructor]